MRKFNYLRFVLILEQIPRFIIFVICPILVIFFHSWISKYAELFILSGLMMNFFGVFLLAQSIFPAGERGTSFKGVIKKHVKYSIALIDSGLFHMGMSAVILGFVVQFVAELAKRIN